MARRMNAYACALAEAAGLRAESFGSVLVEALACGTPVVATRCGGPEDIVTEAVGMLVPKEDSEALADAFQAVLDHPERYDPARLRAYAVESFSWERIARQTVALYQEAVARFRGENARELAGAGAAR